MNPDDFYRQNLAIIEERFGDLARRIESVDATQRVEVAPTQRGIPTLYYKTPDGRRLLLHSQFDPLKEAYQLVNSKRLSEVQIVFVLGIGLAYHIEHLCKSTDFSGTIYVIEPSLEIFKAALQNRDLRAILSDRRISFYIDPDISKIRDSIYNQVYHYVFKSEFIFLPAYQGIFNDYYRQVIDAINTQASRRIFDYLTTQELSGEWERNSLGNLPFIIKSVPINKFFDKFKDMPGIIVAAGPSLDKNVLMLKPLLSKSAVISMGTSLRPLIRAGIKPHFVIVVDASEVVLKQFEGLSDFDLEGIWLLSEISVSPKLVKRFYPRVLFYYAMANPFIKRVFESAAYDSMYLESGGSVANSALVAALKLGLNPVIFVAQDYCLEKDRSHASGTIYEDSRYTDQKGINYMVLPGNYEKEVVSFRNFFTFLRWTENFISKYPDKKFFNATAGGAVISGTELTTLEELNKRLPALESGQRTEDTLLRAQRQVPAGFDKVILERITRTLRDLRKVDKFIKYGLKLCSEVVEAIKGRRKLSDEKFREQQRRVVEFFIRLKDVDEIIDLVSLRTRNDLALMYCDIETSKIKMQGYSQAMERMPEIFKKYRESSRLVERGFKAAIKQETLMRRIARYFMKRRP